MLRRARGNSHRIQRELISRQGSKPGKAETPLGGSVHESPARGLARAGALVYDNTRILCPATPVATGHPSKARSVDKALDHRAVLPPQQRQDDLSGGHRVFFDLIVLCIRVIDPVIRVDCLAPAASSCTVENGKRI